MKKIIFLLCILLMVTTGCENSIYRLLYNSLDLIIYRTVTGYVDPNPEQDRFLRQKIETHLRWHRREELPKYAVTLQALRGRMAAGLKATDLKWIQDRFDRHGADLYNEIADDVASFLLSLDRNQVEQMDRKIGESISEIEKKSAESDEKRVREMEQSTARLMEFMYGSLTAKQKDEIARGVRQIDTIDTERLRLYRERRVEFINLLREKPGKSTLKKYIARLVINPERSYPGYYRERSERRDKAVAEGFLKFDRELVAAGQRANAVKKIDMLIQVLRELNKG